MLFAISSSDEILFWSSFLTFSILWPYTSHNYFIVQLFVPSRYLCFGFYYTVLCVSAVLAISRCPSIYHTCAFISIWLKISSNFFLSWWPNYSSFFWAQPLLHNSKGNPSAGALNKCVFRKICRFCQCLVLSWNWYKVRPWLVRNISKNS